jgi:hypothetical protein
MSDKSQIIDALTVFVQANSKGNDSIVAKVKTVDVVNYTCYCEPIGDYADVMDVKIIINPSYDKGLVIMPKVDSIVMLTFVSDSDAYISMFSEVDSIYLNGDLYEGLVKVNDLVTKLNNLENKVNALITAFNSWIPVPNDGGAALKTALTTWVGTSLTPTVKADLENITVKHGNGT